MILRLTCAAALMGMLLSGCAPGLGALAPASTAGEALCGQSGDTWQYAVSLGYKYMSDQQADAVRVGYDQFLERPAGNNLPDALEGSWKRASSVSFNANLVSNSGNGVQFDLGGEYFVRNAADGRLSIRANLTGSSEETLQHDYAQSEDSFGFGIGLGCHVMDELKVDLDFERISYNSSGVDNSMVSVGIEYLLRFRQQWVDLELDLGFEEEAALKTTQVEFEATYYPLERAGVSLSYIHRDGDFLDGNGFSIGASYQAGPVLITANWKRFMRGFSAENEVTTVAAEYRF